jgi:arginine decarboxylase
MPYLGGDDGRRVAARRGVVAVRSRFVRPVREVSGTTMYVPKKLFFTKGVGTHREKLTSFELALRDAQIACYNLVRVSSIYPPNCDDISIEEGLKELHPGQIVHVVMSESATAEPNRQIAASVGVAKPRDRNMFGYLSEHHAYGQTAKIAADYAEDLAAEMLATVLGVEFNPDSSWDEKREIWKIADVIYETKEVTQTAVGDKDGRWTTVVAAAILLP